MTIWVILGFIILIALMIAVDLGINRRQKRTFAKADAALSAELWVLAALSVSLLLVNAYHEGWVPLEGSLRREASPYAAWVQFICAYTVELALSLDNLVVLSLMLAHFKVPDALRPRLVYWVLLVCLVLRGGLLAAGSSILTHPWTIWIFTALLVLAAIRTFAMPDDSSNLEGRALIRWSRRWTGTTPQDESVRPPTQGLRGWFRASPLVTFVMVGAAADLSFALDSIPAVFSVTKDPLVALTSNVMAILTLRSIFFSLSGYLAGMRYLRVGLVVVLLGLAIKSVAWNNDPRHAVITLAALLGVMGVAVVASMRYARTKSLASRTIVIEDRPTPLEDVSEALTATRRNIKKLVILTAGFLVLAIAVAIGPLPGPGFTIVAPIGIAILASEFVWARKLLGQLEYLQTRTDVIAKRSPLWSVPLVVIGFWIGVWACAQAIHRHWHNLSVSLGFTLLGGGFIPIGFWAYRRIVLWRQKRQAPKATPVPLDPDNASTNSSTNSSTKAAQSAE